MINSNISWNWSANQNQGNFKVKNVVEYLNYYPAKKSRENTISKIDTCGVIMLFCIFCGNNGGICQNTIWGVIAVFIRLIKIVNPSSSFLKLKDGIKVSFPPVQNVWRFNESCMIMCMIFQKFEAHAHNDGSRGRQRPGTKFPRILDFFVDTCCNGKLDNIIQCFVAFLKIIFVFESVDFSRSYNTSTCCSAWAWTFKVPIGESSTCVID